MARHRQRRGFDGNSLSQVGLDPAISQPGAGTTSVPSSGAGPVGAQTAPVAEPAVHTPTATASQPPERRSWIASIFARSDEDQPALAALLLLGGLMLLGLQDAIVKLLTAHVTLWQFQILRGGAVLVILAVSGLLFARQTNLWPIRLWAVALRSMFLALAMVFYFGGAPFLPLAIMAAGLYTFPLFSSLLAWLFLGEKVGPRRIFAIALGFGGTLLIIKPWDATFSAWAIMPIVAGFSYGCSILCTRRLCRQENPVTLAYGVNIMYVLVGVIGLVAVVPFLPALIGPAPGQPVVPTDMPASGWSQSAWQAAVYGAQWEAATPYLFGTWHALTGLAAILVLATALLNLVANLGMSRAYQSAEPSWLAPFDYSYLIFATFWGVVLFDSVPAGSAFVGMAMIAFAGSFVAWRERQDNRRRRANAHRALR